MSQVAEFFANYWWLILIIFVVVAIVAVIRAVRRVIKEGGGAFDLNTIKKNTAPNLEFVRQKGQAMMKDADVICEIKNGRVIPKKQDIMTFRTAYKAKYKAASFYIAKEDKVVYFFCKSEAGLQRRLQNLLFDRQAQHEFSRKVAEESLVLLKNEGVLPLNKEQKIAFIGQYAVKPRYQGGGSSHINSFKVTGAWEMAKEDFYDILTKS